MSVERRVGWNVRQISRDDLHPCEVIMCIRLAVEHWEETDPPRGRLATHWMLCKEHASNWRRTHGPASD